MFFKKSVPTVNINIEIGNGIVLNWKGKSHFGWAILGGYVYYVESLEDVARSEELEEPGLKIELLHQFHAYSDLSRDCRQHNISLNKCGFLQLFLNLLCLTMQIYWKTITNGCKKADLT